MEPIGPVFVAGCPRSGTSALSWAIAADAGYWTSVETHFLYYLSRGFWLENAYASSAGAGSYIDVHAVSVSELLGCVGEGIDRLMRARSGGRRWVDGSPENLMVGGTLLVMFPRAQLFHVVRDPKSVCLSMLSSGFEEPWATDIDEAIRTWNHYVAVGRQLETDHPERVNRIRQEDMVAAPGAVAHQIGTCLRIADVEPVAQFLAHTRINSSADKASYAWTNPPRDVGPERFDPIAFEARYSEHIRVGTAALAACYGYG
jgi:hypothetical protein